jgi:murein DD-endopeptidase MepM/ murein hydrolase activator NlpD
MKCSRAYSFLAALVAGIILFSGLAAAEKIDPSQPAASTIAPKPGVTAVVVTNESDRPTLRANCLAWGGDAYSDLETTCSEYSEHAAVDGTSTDETIAGTDIEPSTRRRAQNRRRPAIAADDRAALVATDLPNFVAGRNAARTPSRSPAASTPEPTALDIETFQASQLVASVETVPGDLPLLGILCKDRVSQEQEFAPVQQAEAGAPVGSDQLTWVPPATALYIAPFSGAPGSPAGHEGIDYVHTDPQIAHVPVVSAAEGRVVYVRDGCPQSRMFGANRQLRECGAGWGNHVVVDHGEGLLTRYAHLAPESIPARVGDRIAAGDRLGEMGNTGRSDTRHLHFEVGVTAQDLDACAPAQSFDWVYNPATLGV